MDADPVRIVAQGQLTMPDAAWEQARSRAAVIGSLAARGTTGIADADRAAAELGASRRQVYVLLGRYRQGSGYVFDLAVRRSTGGKGGNRLAGKLNFYVALVDDVLRRGHHNETIGILICGTTNDRSVRYSLGRSTSPMAVAAYTYDKLPPHNKHSPTKGISSQRWDGPNLGRPARHARRGLK